MGHFQHLREAGFLPIADERISRSSLEFTKIKLKLMSVRKDTLFEQFLAPLVTNLLIDREALRQYHESKDWSREGDRFRNPQLTYPDYYQSQNFHGIEGGYLNPAAAVTYDPITRYALAPSEDWVRQALLDRIQTHPRRILDLGCGTGSTTLALKQMFPDAEVVGIDLSPYMLVVADEKAHQAGLKVTFQQHNAEQTNFPSACFDLITASLLFHETPRPTSIAILREAFRLLQAGGEILILDGNQLVLRHTEWLTQIFEEPYIQDFAAGSVDAWMGAVGFGMVQTDIVWGIHQVTRGVKPVVGRSPNFTTVEQGNWQMAFPW
jgi:ubiquinone/menaquinone biosynthesis C-methylase UbiE